jgi:Tol biopolymer transport system component
LTTRNTEASALRVVNVETGAKRTLTERDAMQPAWSPHGRRVAFWFMPPNSGRRDVATVPAAGGEAVVVTKDATTNWNPVWSPDGRFLYFASDRGGNMNFWRVRVDEQTGEVLSEPQAVVTPSKFSRHLGFSRDGRRMVYVQTVNQSNIQAVEFEAKNERTIGEPFWITRGDREVVRPELSPDGKLFVMRLPRRTQDDVVLVNREGTNWRDLTDDKFFDRYPRFSPDGRRVAFTSDRGGRYEIWTIDTDGTNLRQITFDTRGDTTFPIWSPDGRRLVYRDDRVNVIIDLGRGWHEQTPQPLPPLASAEESFVVWDWSPDGDKLSGNYFQNGRRGIGCFSFKTGRYEFVADFDSQAMWMPDSRHLVFGHEGKAFVVDTSTKKVRELLATRHEHIRSVDVSADGRMLYYTVPSSESDIWLLDLD